MFDNKKRKNERLMSGLPDTLSSNIYNMVIGGTILYGFLLNAIMISMFSSVFANMNPIALIIGYFILCIIGAIINAKSNNPLISFLGYNLVVIPIGALLSVCLPTYPTSSILLAIILTGIVTIIMTVISTIKPQLFAGMGRTLFISLLVGIIIEIVATLLGYRGDIFNWFFVLIFSCYIGFDWSKAQAYPKTLDNAIDSALDIYMDIINLFLRILEIINKNKD